MSTSGVWHAESLPAGKELPPKGVVAKLAWACGKYLYDCRICGELWLIVETAANIRCLSLKFAQPSPAVFSFLREAPERFRSGGCLPGIYFLRRDYE